MTRWCAVLLALAGCARTSDTTSPERAPAPAPATPRPAAPTDVMARALCDHYWKFSSASARPYPSVDECITAETKPRACAAAQATACAEFARALEPDQAGAGLMGSADCAACLGGPAPELEAAMAEQQRALDAATLTVHAARIATRAERPTELGAAAGAVVVRIDVELTGYGYRIDPDDFVLGTPAGAAFETLASDPFTERLTHAGAPVAWTDPTIMNDPDLRIVAYFQLPGAAPRTPLTIGYEGKLSRAFVLR